MQTAPHPGSERRCRAGAFVAGTKAGARRHWRFVAALALALALPPAAPAQITCRGDALGATTCNAAPVPRPRPRPLLDDGTRGLDRVQQSPPAGSQAPALIPGRRTNAFGRILLGPGEAPAGPCRTDALGNTRCR